MVALLLRQFVNAFQVAHEGGVFALLRILVGLAQQEGRMHGDVSRPCAELVRATVLADRERLAAERERGGGAERDNQYRFDEFQFLLQPPAIVLHLAGGRLFVDAALAALDGRGGRRGGGGGGRPA